MHARIQKFSLRAITLQLERQNAPVILLSNVSGPLCNKRRKYIKINGKTGSSNFQVESNLTFEAVNIKTDHSESGKGGGG